MAETEAGVRPMGNPANAFHMVRTTQQAHYQLSRMADQKASILMGATFVIFTVAVSQSRDGEVAPAPLLILGAFAFATAVLSILAILPKTHPQRAGEVNLLFFGSFAGLRRDDYIEALLDTMASDEEIYRTMANDIWQNGQVLSRKKYRLLGYAYRVFLVGLTLSFLAFLVTLLWR
ncbi:Pycsar system effector family protein [Sphingomonas sp.]|uniref:Pycsar system effector family protein n=1 Tax=Sphingomonas sp. TaxID=28214 RepID=UPI003B00D958